MSHLLTLKKVFGFDALRESQTQIVDGALSGENLIGSMPTSGGKSLCYQLPAIHLGKVCIVISPLIALMNDQVGYLKSIGISAHACHSNMTQQDRIELKNAVDNGSVQFIYVSPERFVQEKFLRYISAMNLIITVDEAHCITGWGDDFRPEYRKIGPSIRFLEQLKRFKIQVLAFTATASDTVIADIANSLKSESEFNVVKRGSIRENMIMDVICVDTVLAREKLLKAAVQQNVQSGAVIVYAASRNKVLEIYSLLSNLSAEVFMYHAGLSSAEREKNMQSFMTTENSVMVATNAFGMGVNKANVRAVIHSSTPARVDDYLQEIGRGGRDGLPYKAFLISVPDQDYSTQDFFVDSTAPNTGKVKAALTFLREMVAQGKMKIFIAPGDFEAVFGIRAKQYEAKAILNQLVKHRALQRISEFEYNIPAIEHVDVSRLASQRAELMNHVNHIRSLTSTRQCYEGFALSFIDKSYLAHKCGRCSNCLKYGTTNNSMNAPLTLTGITLSSPRNRSRTTDRKKLKDTDILSQIIGWRMVTATRKRLPEYLVLSDSVIKSILKNRDKIIEAGTLRVIAGVSATKSDEYVNDIIEILRN